MSEEPKVERRGGFRPRGGRPKGAKNVRTLLQEAKAKRFGALPLDDLLRVAAHWRDEVEKLLAVPEGQRDQKTLLAALRELTGAAEAAAPYLHPKLAAMAVADVTPQAPSVIRAPQQPLSSAEWLQQFKPATVIEHEPTPIGRAIEEQADKDREARRRAIGRPWEPGDSIQ